MPKRSKYFQLDFASGMVEAPKDDTDFEMTKLKWNVPQSSSVLYLENFDHTIMAGALVKRMGMALAKEEVITGEYGLPGIWESDYDQTGLNLIAFDVDRYTNLSAEDDTDDSDPAVVQGALNMPFNKPVSQDIIVTFLRQATYNNFTQPQKTRVVAYCQEPQASLRWTNPHTDGPVGSTGDLRTAEDPSPYPGWDVYGSLSDCARFGGSLVFTTELPQNIVPTYNETGAYQQSWVKAGDGSATGMYPCYVWTFWDLRRKLDDNEFWNTVAEWAPVNFDPTSYNGDDLTNYAADNTFSKFKVLWPTHWFIRNEAVSFNSYRTNEAVTDLGMTDETPDASDAELYFPALLTDVPTTPINVCILEAPGRKFSTTQEDKEKLTLSTKYAYLNDEFQYIESMETIRGVSYVADEYRWEPYSMKYGRKIPYEIVEEVLTIGAREYPIKAIVAHAYWKDSSDGLTMEDPMPTGKDLETPMIYVYGTRLPNYIENGTPRPWLQGEKIPLVVTAVIRGVEIKLSDYTYVVQRGQTPPAPILYYTEASRLSADSNVGQGNYISNDARSQNVDTLLGIHRSAAAVWAQYYSSNQRIGGKVPVYSFVMSRYVKDIIPKGKLYDRFIAHLWEPFNPTAEAPYITATDRLSPSPPDPGAGQGIVVPLFDEVGGLINATNWDSLWSLPMDIDNDDAAGYRPHHTEGNYIWITVKIPNDKHHILLEAGVSAIKIYIAETDPTQSLLRSINLFAFTKDVPPTLYGLPAEENFDDINKYRLLKTFLLDGEGTPFADDSLVDADAEKWKLRWKRGMYTETNAWLQLDDSIIAVAQNTDGTVGNGLTPDFMVWDYGTNTPPLSLNSSAEYWDGYGAKVVCSIKGRTFLAGTIDQYGEEEQAVIRFSDVQNGVISQDLFSKENQIRVGGLPITAMQEYREQLWVFNRQEAHRIQMPNVALVESWEYLDKIPGQGTYSPKTVITTPYGVIWCNDGGVWLSDGRMPENLAVPIQSYYNMVANGTPHPYAAKIALPGFPLTDGYNPCMELSYDEFRDELVISSPFAAATSLFEDPHDKLYYPYGEYRLIWSFKMKSWRSESFDHPAFNSPLSEFNVYEELSFA